MRIYNSAKPKTNTQKEKTMLTVSIATNNISNHFVNYVGRYVQISMSLLYYEYHYVAFPAGSANSNIVFPFFSILSIKLNDISILPLKTNFIHTNLRVNKLKKKV